MIKNKRQYQEIADQLTFLEGSIADLLEIIKQNPQNTDWILQKETFIKQKLKLKRDLDHYKNLVSGKQDLEFDSFRDDMNDAIMSFRIASGMTQKELAEKMYIQQQQIQRYEQREYLNVDFERILQLLEVLDVQLILRKERKNVRIESVPELKIVSEKIRSRKVILEIEGAKL